MRLLLVGDVNLAGIVNERLRLRPPSDPWGDTLPLFEAADLRICNLECTLADAGRRWHWPFKKYFHRSAEKNAAALTAAGIDIAVLGNNHTFDFGAVGLERTLLALDAAGVAHAGAGRTLAEAEAPAIVGAAGLRLGVVAFMDDERWAAAGPSKAGRFYSRVDLGDARAARVLASVRAARPHVDVLIASAHWGSNWGDQPPAEHRAFGRALVDAGADLVFGHSAHVLRGVEWAGRAPILYSAGDFVDGYRPSSRGPNQDSAIFRADWQVGGIPRLTAIPVVIRNGQARLAPAHDAERIVARLDRLCAELGTATRRSPDGRTLEFIPAG